MVEGEWQEPGVVLKDGSVGQWSIAEEGANGDGGIDG